MLVPYKLSPFGILRSRIRAEFARAAFYMSKALRARSLGGIKRKKRGTQVDIQILQLRKHDLIATNVDMSPLFRLNDDNKRRFVLFLKFLWTLKRDFSPSSWLDLILREPKL